MERAAPPRSAETTVWQGTPSPLLNLPFDLMMLVAALAATAALLLLGTAAPQAVPAIPWLIAAAWLICGGVVLAGHVRRRSVRYTLTSERLRITTGIFSTRTEEIELRRVRDTAIFRPFLLRLVGLGNVEVFAADPTTPQVVLRGVPNPDDLQSSIRGLVQEMIGRYGVREIDII